MKRSILYLAAGVLALTACTSENDLEKSVQERKAIGFENVVNKLSRADITSGSLSKFNVFGYYTTPLNTTVAVPVFEDIAVTRQDNGTWTYNTDDVAYRYWVPGGHYYFYAYSCGNVVKLDSLYGKFSMDMGEGLTPSDRVLKINNYLCDASHQHDLVYASNTGATKEDPFAGILGKENGNSLVGLQFKHILSKVQAQFTSDFPEDYKVTISDVSIQNIRNIGSYNPNAANGWQNVTRKEGEFPFVYLLNTTDASINPISTSKGKEAAKTNAAYVIPYQYNGSDATEESGSTWVYIKFLLNVENKGQNVLTRELTGKFNPNWIAGVTYTYNIEVSGSAANLQVIGFTTAIDEFGQTVSGWGTGSDIIIIDK